MALTTSVIAGPRAHGSAMPRRVDVVGHHLVAGGGAPWSFEALAAPRRPGPGRADQAPTPAPAWRLRPGFGVTDAGCVIVGLALALAGTRGADDTGRAMITRHRLDPGADVVVVPDLVHAARPLTTLPLAVVVTTADEHSALVTELTGTTQWSLTGAGPR